jgi:hypothetical protein
MASINIKRLFTDPKKFIQNAGKSAAKPVAYGERAAGTIGGFMVGGPAGAMAGYKLGDSLGNIAEDALAGRSVKKNLGKNALNAGLSAAGVYGSTKLPSQYGGGATSAGSTNGSNVPELEPFDINRFVGHGATDNLGGGNLPLQDPGWGGILKRLNSGNAGGILNALGGVGGIAGKVGQLAGAGQQGQGGQQQQGGQSWMDQLLGIAKKPFEDPIGTGMLALATKQALDARSDKARSNDLQDKALARGEEQWNANAPLREMGMKKLLNPTRPDLSAVVADPRNPYAAGYVPRVKRLPIAGRMI